LLAYLSGDTKRVDGDASEGWALAVLGFAFDVEPSRSDINRRFRELVRDAHPDHGGSVEEAGRRILDLTEAKRILLSVGYSAAAVGDTRTGNGSGAATADADDAIWPRG
jgi:hypothetical protein